MKLPTFRRIYKTDYDSDSQGLVEKLATSINNGFEVLYEALNKKVSLRENILCTVKDVEVTVGSNGVPLSTTSITKDSAQQGKVDGITVINANNLTNTSAYPTSGIFVNFMPSENGATITHITGLQANNNYRLTLIMWLI